MAYHKKRHIFSTLLLAFITLFLVIHVFFIPSKLFSDSTSTILLDEQNALLGARIAQDGQWRFPETDSINQ